MTEKEAIGEIFSGLVVGAIVLICSVTLMFGLIKGCSADVSERCYKQTNQVSCWGVENGSGK